mmetsp:Transcript_28264/g.31665  ORF Transcript_28264/g.31665 Transcript_28264/m.31665 type:complete len:485 (+) Transcript_28264:566-2020(+)
MLMLLSLSIMSLSKMETRVLFPFVVVVVVVVDDTRGCGGGGSGGSGGSDPGPVNDNLNSDNNVGPIMKDCQEDDMYMSYMTPERADKLLKETNSLLARRWRLSRLIDSDIDKKLLLATEKFIPTAAANRIEKNGETKMELFGLDRMDKKIMLYEDLASEKSDIGVEDGYVQLLPTRDLAGRAVLFFQYDPNLYSKQSKNFRKVLFYMMASALEDDDTARKGISMVVWNGAPTQWFDPFWRVFEKISSPFRISKLHYCQVSYYDSSYQVLEKRERGETDVRIHKGSLQECMHGLITYGIPSHFIPLKLDGSINSEDHLKWIELRRRIESFPVNQKVAIVLVPKQNDVLLGKRKMSMNGNVLYHQTIMKNIKMYDEASSDEVRHSILMKVWDSVNNLGGNFLLQVEDGQLWEKLDLRSALYKIGQAFDFLCIQLYAPKISNLNAADNKPSDDEDIFFGWNDFFNGKKCLNLISPKGDGFGKAPACW